MSKATTTLFCEYLSFLRGPMRLWKMEQNAGVRNFFQIICNLVLWVGDSWDVEYGHQCPQCLAPLIRPLPIWGIISSTKSEGVAPTPLSATAPNKPKTAYTFTEWWTLSRIKLWCKQRFNKILCGDRLVEGRKSCSDRQMDLVAR